MNKNNFVQQQLVSFIDTGEFAPGDKLPSERQLIDQLCVSRSALRKGLDALEREGRIWRRVGKGTFLSSNSEAGAFSDLTKLSQQVTPVQMMRARLSLEPAIAREAAANATEEVVLKLKDARDRAIDSSSWEEYEKQDDVFHYSVAEATGNTLLHSLFHHLNQVRRAVAWAEVIRDTEKPSRDHSSFKEHDTIVNAIEARDPAAAHKAMRDHLNSVSARLFGE